MVLSGFRAIIEYSAYDGQNYHTIQIARPINSQPELTSSGLKSKDDYIIYAFNRFALDGFELTKIPFKQLLPFTNYFKKDQTELKNAQKKYSKQKIPFEEFLEREGINLNGNRELPKQFYPAYEPIISIVEVLPDSKEEGEISAFNYVTELERERMFEFMAMAEALGYNPSNGENIEWRNKNIERWIEKNAKVSRLANPVADIKLDVGDIKYCEPGEHYWHTIDNTKFIRKFYVAERRIETPELKESIDSIPKEECPDALDHIVEKEGNLIMTR